MDVVFYVGLHQPADAANFQRACISINRVRGRRKPVCCPNVLLDSGAFTEIHNHGAYRHEPTEYAAEVKRLHAMGVMRRPSPLGSTARAQGKLTRWSLAYDPNLRGGF